MVERRSGVHDSTVNNGHGAESSLLLGCGDFFVNRRPVCVSYQLVAALVMWTNKTAETACIPSPITANELYTGTLKDCVQLVRVVPLLWDTLDDGSIVLSSMVTADGSVDHYAFVVGLSAVFSSSADGGQGVVPVSGCLKP